MKLFPAFLALATSVLTVNAFAVDSKGGFAIKGVGNAPCSTYRAMIESNDPQKYLFAGWLNGYITGQNQHWPETFDATSWENIETLSNYLYHHCGQNPSLSFFQVSTQLLNELYDKRITQFIGATDASSGNQSLKVYRQIIGRVQHELTDKGYYQGPTNGDMNEELSTAIIQFKKDNNIEAIQLLDQQFLHALLMGK